MPHGKSNVELAAIIGSAQNMLTVNDLTPHRLWRNAECGNLARIASELPVVLSCNGLEPLVLFGKDDCYMSRAYVTLPMMEFLARYEPVEEFTDIRPVSPSRVA